MKKVITFIFIVFVTPAIAQTLALTEDLTVRDDYSGPSSPSIIKKIDVEHLYLNGYTITVECESELKTTHIYGPGYVQTYTQGCDPGDWPKSYVETGFDNVTECVEYSGEQNWLEFKDGNGDITIPNCTTLSTESFETIVSPFPVQKTCKVVDISGKVIFNGIMDKRTISTLPKNKILIVLTEGRKPKKIVLN